LLRLWTDKNIPQCVFSRAAIKLLFEFDRWRARRSLELWEAKNSRKQPIFLSEFSETAQNSSEVWTAFAYPEKYDWTAPDAYERAVFDALETGKGFAAGAWDKRRMLQVALTQPEPLRILTVVDGIEVRRYQ